MKKLESGFRTLLMSLNLEPDSTWEQVTFNIIIFSFKLNVNIKSNEELF